MDEEKARLIGIAYGVYTIICDENGQHPVEPSKFKDTCCECIEQIRQVSGLVDENSLQG